MTSGWDDPVSIEPDVFDRQCAWLRRTGRVVRLGSVIGLLAAGRSLPPRTTVLTFDDGFADFGEWAVPIMLRHRVPAALYVVAGAATPNGVPVNWIRGLDPAAAPPLLDIEQIREMRRQGWEIGSHSLAHRDLPTLTEEECLTDLRDSREILSDVLGHAVDVLAYPFGHHSAHVRRAAHRAGYSIALALPEGPEPAGPFAVPRTGIYRANGSWTFRVKASRWFAGVRRTVKALPIRR